jgi:hypothetical protein
MAFGDSDLAFMMSDVFSKPVVIGGVSTTGIVRDYDGLANKADVFLVENELVVSVQSSSLPNIADGQTGTVNGIAVQVRYYTRMNDGGITRIYCVKVTP